MIRSLAPDPFDAPLADRQSIDLLDRHGAMWDQIMDTLLGRPEPTVLSWPCPECGDHRIKCDCIGDEQ